MEFWGVEVKPGKPVTVKPDELIHVSQASLDDNVEKGESVRLFVTVDGGEKFLIGTLIEENIPQIALNIAFEKDFVLSHSSSQGSVHFIGYKSPDVDFIEDLGSDSDEEVPAADALNVVKDDSKPDAKPVEEVKSELEDDDDSDESSEEDSSDSEEDMDVNDEYDDEDSEDGEEEEITKKPELSNKKRANESESETTISAKKAKPAVTSNKK